MKSTLRKRLTDIERRSLGRAEALPDDKDLAEALRADFEELRLKGLITPGGQVSETCPNGYDRSLAILAEMWRAGA